MMRRKIREEFEDAVCKVSKLECFIDYYKGCMNNRKAKIAIHQLESLIKKWESENVFFDAYNDYFSDEVARLIENPNPKCYFCKKGFKEGDEMYIVEKKEKGSRGYVNICFHKKCWEDKTIDVDEDLFPKKTYFYGILTEWLNDDGEIEWDTEKELLIYAYLNAEAQVSAELLERDIKHYLMGLYKWEFLEDSLKTSEEIFRDKVISELTGDAGKYVGEDMYEEEKKIILPIVNFLVDEEEEKKISEEEYRKRIEELEKKREKLEKEEELVKEEFYRWDEKYKALQGKEE